MKARYCLFLVLLTACGSSSSSDDDSPGDSSARRTSTVEDLVEALCAAEGPCCVDAGYSADPAECRSFFGAIGTAIPYDGAEGAQCIEWLRTASHDYTRCIDGDSPPASCDAAFSSPPGTHRPGEACSSPSDCAPSSEGQVDCHVEIMPSETTMTCQVRIEGHVGDAPCLATLDDWGSSNVVFEGGAPSRGYLCDLRDGVYCDGTACAATSGAGGPCDEVRLCDLASYCDFGTRSCVTRRGVGTACDSDSQCVTTAFCSSGACTPRLGAGSPCTDSAACESRICSSGTCYASDDAGAGLGLICVSK